MWLQLITYNIELNDIIEKVAGQTNVCIGNGYGQFCGDSWTCTNVLGNKGIGKHVGQMYWEWTQLGRDTGLIGHIPVYR